ncbi:hypothetical protein [Streptomyces sp. NPDC096153]|uniref:RCC1 domain-containing protein n=1 Tax=Streptomyces sp. NPDC096153 TaxID=3155548 RepID=UPI00332D25C6
MRDRPGVLRLGGVPAGLAAVLSVSVPGTSAAGPRGCAGGALAVAAGDSHSHSLALMGDGTVRAWGSNSDGRLGDGSQTDSDLSIRVRGLSEVRAVAAGLHHSLALLADGTVRAWGDNADGRLGDGTVTSSTVPVQVTGLTDVRAVTGGNEHSLAVLEDGTVWAWGDNGSGGLGNGTAADSAVPVQVAGIPGCRGHGEPVPSPGGRDHDARRALPRALKHGAAPVR